MLKGMPSKLKILLLSMVIANIGSMMFIPILPLYVKWLGASITEIGIFFAIYSIFFALFSIIGGWISDSIGRLRSIAIGSVFGTLGFFLMAIAPVWYYLIPAIAIMTIGMALVYPSVRAVIVEMSAEEKRGRTFGLFDSIFLICKVIGPVLGGYVAETYGFRKLFYLATFLILVATFVRFYLAHSQKIKRDKLKFVKLKSDFSVLVGLIISGGLITWLFIIDGVTDFGFGLCDQLRPVYLEAIIGFDKRIIGILASATSLASIPFFTISGILSDKFGGRPSIVLGCVTGALSFYIFVCSGSIIGFLLAAILLGIMIGFFSPAFDLLLSKTVPQKHLGITYGTFMTAIGLVAIPAPYLGALLWDKLSPKLPFISFASILIFVIVPCWIKLRVGKRASNE